MARCLRVVTLAVAVACLWPVTADAATAPSSAPELTSPPYVYPATFHWTPGADVTNASQGVYRSSGVCTQPPAAGGPIVTGLPATQTDFVARPVDGIYCYTIRTTDLLGGTDTSPGLTVAVDTTAPTATVAVSGQAAGGLVGGTVGVAGSSADAVSGVASSVLRVGAVGACPTGPVVGASWDTTGYANGAYDVCNVVTDNAGLVTVAKLTVTVANAVVPVAIAPGSPAGPQSGQPVTSPADRGKPAPAGPPPAPTNLKLVLPRSKPGTGQIPLTLRWTNPAVPDLARVSVILNRARAPRGPADGAVVYSGLRPSAAFTLRAGQKASIALFAYDRTGNVSHAARRTVSLAPLIPLRPVTGSVVGTAPRLTWKAKQRTVYYNVQVFRNGKRVLVRWPSRPFLSLPATRLSPGTYVWYVWPAVRHKGAAPTFGSLIGRATFVLE